METLTTMIVNLISLVEKMALLPPVVGENFSLFCGEICVSSRVLRDMSDRGFRTPQLLGGSETWCISERVFVQVSEPPNF